MTPSVTPVNSSQSTPNPKPITLENGFGLGGILKEIIPPHCPGYETVTPPLSQTGTDHFWMLEAIRESMKGAGITNPNPAVGCIIVDSKGNEISRGATQAFRGLHAERVAFQKLDSSLGIKGDTEGATAYVTLEPCSHTGYQPPCIDVLIASKIKRIVIARGDPNPIVDGNGIRKLREAGKEVHVGLLANEATAWNFPFLASIVLKRPIFILKWAQTLDGQLADDTGTSKWISGPLSRAYTHWLRQRYDAILVGVGTVLADYPTLNVRDCNPPHQAQPLPIVFDPKGACLSVAENVQTKLCNTTFNETRPLVYVTSRNAIEKAGPHSTWLHQRPNVTILEVRENEGITDLVNLLSGQDFQNILGRPLQSVFVEGGPKTLRAFLKSGFADALHVFIAPAFTGGSKNRVALDTPLCDASRFELISTFRLGNDTVMEMVSPEASVVFRS